MPNDFSIPTWIFSYLKSEVFGDNICLESSRKKKKEERNDEQGIGSYLVSLDAACKMDDDSTWKMHDTRANLHNQQHPTVYSK